MPGTLPRNVRWTPWSGAEAGLEHLDLAPDSEGVVATGVVIGSSDRGPFALSYRARVDAGWRLRDATLATTSGLQLSLSVDGRGRWTEGGRPRPELEGCVDVDIACTPFTNTLPIRRLALRRGESAEIRVAYVAVPDLALTFAPQRYTCLDPGRRYRFESLENGFTAELPVDPQGLVLDYPGLFRRL